MVSLVHEGLIQLVRDRPDFIADLLTNVLHVEVKALSAAARKAFKMLPNPQTYVDEWRRQISDEGRTEGRAEGEAKAVLKILAKRELDVTARQQQQIQQCTDLATLDRWLDLAFSVASVDELFRS